MFKKILVPLDGSELAEQALETAIYLAQKTDSELIFLSASRMMPIVATETTAGQGVQIIDRPQALSQSSLSGYLYNIRQSKSPQSLKSRIKVVEGEAAGVIVDTAVAEEVDLIVMSTHGRSGFTRWVMGSVTERVLRQAPCPVLAIRESIPLKNMLITLDGSKISEYALKPGLEIAKQLDCQVTLLSVEPPETLNPTDVDMLDKVEPGLGDVLISDFYHRTEDYLQKTALSVQSNIEHEINIAPKTGRIAPAILKHIESNNVDIVVLTTHGRTGLKRWLYGSVTEKILRSADCALLVVRPPLSELK